MLFCGDAIIVVSLWVTTMEYMRLKCEFFLVKIHTRFFLLVVHISFHWIFVNCVWSFGWLEDV